MIRVVLPYHLQKLASVGRVVELEVASPVTQRSILDALESRYPMLRGTVRNHKTGERNAFIRYFACGEDYSLNSPDEPLPEEVAQGKEEFMIVGAMAGG
jgi:molybdopterin synthase sulfur carrier subunit